MKNKNKKVYMTKKRKAKLATRKYILLILLGVIIPDAIIGYHATRLQEELDMKSVEPVIITKVAYAQEFEVYEVKTEVIREVTMYNSVEWQTDDTPCISANGTNICEGAKTGKEYCASNSYPFGTILHVDKLGECEVVDRMNKRYKNRVDWYAEMDINRAINFGLQKLNIKEVIKK